MKHSESILKKMNNKEKDYIGNIETHTTVEEFSNLYKEKTTKQLQRFMVFQDPL